MFDKELGCTCFNSKEFDFERAYLDLYLRHEQLAEIVAQYMAEAQMKRPGRVKNALTMSKTIKTRIIGGDTVPVGVFPDCCLVGDVNPSGQFRWYCTGVLIHPRAVLTAAHCFNPEQGLVPNVVALNTQSAAASDINNAEIIRLQQSPIRNPLYTSFNKTNDIAVLILRRNATTVPAAIATDVETIASNRVRVAGFGSNMPAGKLNFGLKRSVGIPISFLRHNPQENLSPVESVFGFDADLEFVAGGDGHDACYGDSGGPAYIEAGDTVKVIGLVSRKVKNAVQECGSGGVYTRLDSQAGFINSIIETNNL